jgi:hypothetical protein
MGLRHWAEAVFEHSGAVQDDVGGEVWNLVSFGIVN